MMMQYPSKMDTEKESYVPSKREIVEGSGAEIVMEKVVGQYKRRLAKILRNQGEPYISPVTEL
nr:unnamed protein product [Callosobruchus chinensis]